MSQLLKETVLERRLEGRVAIVTGAAQGIGAAYAHALAQHGAAVVCADVLDSAPVASAIREAGGRAIAARTDVSDSVSVAKMITSTIDAFGRIDVLVNNAALFGTLSLKPFEQISSEEWDRVMMVNVRGAFECAKAVAPQMRKNGSGKIINIASGTVYKGTPMMLHYVASKGAIIAMSRVLARELGNDGICVNSLAPGLTISESVAANPDWSGQWRDAVVNSRAIKRAQTPEDLLGALIFLSSAESDFMTGQVLVVDGGSSHN